MAAVQEGLDSSMKASILGGLLVVCVVMTAPAPSQEEGGVDELAALREQLAAQEVELAAQRDAIEALVLLSDQTVGYLAAQAQASRELDRAFAQAESQGFTAGINYQSRETLLGGLRAYTSSQRSQLPGAPPERGPDARASRR